MAGLPIRRLQYLTWQEAGEVRDRHPNLVMLPVGALEQHGYHLPLGTDTFMVDWVCEHVASGFDNVAIAPAIPFGTSENHDAFPGTVSISLDTLKGVVVDVGLDLFRQGFDIVLIVNGHGGNVQALAAAAHELRQRSGRLVAHLMWPALVQDAWACLDGNVSWHADESETSLMLHMAPNLVHMDRATDEPPDSLPFFEFTEESLAAVKIDLGLPKSHQVSNSGTIGLARLATGEKGGLISDEAVRNLTAAVTSLLDNYVLLSEKLTGHVREDPGDDRAR